MKKEEPVICGMASFLHIVSPGVHLRRTSLGGIEQRDPWFRFDDLACAIETSPIDHKDLIVPSLRQELRKRHWESFLYR